MDKRIHEQQPLVTIRNTFGENVQFVIPDYQRGYKWTIADVRKLLEDISAFSVGGGLEYYCLQNLTLVCSSREPNQRKVVDGQQRLTTTSIIISYLDYCKKSGANPDIGDLPLLMRDNGSSLFFGDRKKETTQPFFEEKILQGRIWEKVEDGIIKDKVWLSSEYDAQTINRLHDLFGKWLKCNPNTYYNHSDIFHMFCAAMTVAAFFEKQGKSALRDFATKFLDEVRFLHNIVEENASNPGGGTGVLEAEVFSKINGFRVPLDCADLLRAIFITDAVDKTTLGGGITEREVRLNEARVKLGLEIDEMSAWWQEEQHQKYFSMFVPNNEQNDAFDTLRYPINILYSLFSAANGAKSIKLEWFEHYDGGISKLYSEIRHFHSVLRDWYEDIKLYHYAGFLAGQCGVDFSNAKDAISDCGIYNLLKKCKKRSDLLMELKRRIFIAVTRQMDDETSKDVEGVKEDEYDVLRERMKGLTNAIEDSSCNWYEEEMYSVQKILVLMDVIAFAEPGCLQENKDAAKKKYKKRTPLANHLDPEFFTCQGEDKEHVFPQTPVGGKDRKKFESLKEKVKAYWELVCDSASDRDASKKTGDVLVARWKDFWKQCEGSMRISDEAFPLTHDDLTEKWRDWLFANEERAKETTRRINQFVMDVSGIELNSIGNIVMLDSGINRGYGNKFYTEKRKEIWTKYRECQPVRLHTYRAFAKEFSGDTTSLDVWGQSSIAANRAAIKRGIEKFFKEVCPEKEVAQ